MSDKRLVLLAGPGEATNMTYHSLARLVRPATVILESPVPRRQFLQRRVKNLGWRTVAGQVLFTTTVLPRLRRAARSRREEITAEYGLNAAPIPEPDANVFRVPSVNSDACIQLLRDQRPDYVFLCGTRIISRRVLDAINATFLNIHAGITPLFRGVHGAYWALVEGRPDACGVTVHLVDQGIDTGGILGQALVNITPKDSFVTYPLLQLGVGLAMVPEVLRRLSQGERWTVAPPAGPSRLWSHPTITQYFHYRRKLGVR